MKSIRCATDRTRCRATSSSFGARAKYPYFFGLLDHTQKRDGLDSHGHPPRDKLAPAARPPRLSASAPRSKSPATLCLRPLSDGRRSRRHTLSDLGRVGLGEVRVPRSDEPRVCPGRQQQVDDVPTARKDRRAQRVPVVWRRESVGVGMMGEQHHTDLTVAGTRSVHQGRPSARRVSAVRVRAKLQQSGDRGSLPPLRGDEEWRPTVRVVSWGVEHISEFTVVLSEKLREGGPSHLVFAEVGLGGKDLCERGLR
mmetsp:Transcript_15444/g.42473  ORF Transcript_15444/g.42473 Transcript_15444/m.42473 type:complete len:254 (-) Transcript_15444:249-1010(-)